MILLRKICPVIIILFVLTTISFGQTKKKTKPKPKPKTPAPASVLKTIAIGKWGIDSISLPNFVGPVEESSSPSKNGDVTWMNYSFTWKKSLQKGLTTDFEVSIDVTSWDTDFAKVTGLPPERATPEGLMEIDLNADKRNKESGSAPVEEADYLIVNGVKGTYFQGILGKNLMYGWQTYRYHKDKAQRINIAIQSKRRDLETGKKIINSLKLQN